MVFDVQFGREKAGELVWEAGAYGVKVSLDCAIPCDTLILLRCYGRTPRGPFLIGLPEPRHGRLTLTRQLTPETLKEAGCLENPPDSFYLSENPLPEPAAEESGTPEPALSATEYPAREPEAPPPHEKKEPLRTGDALLDKLLENGSLRATQSGGALELKCSFKKDEPFALAHIFALCRVENGEAVLRWPVTGSTHD